MSTTVTITEALAEIKTINKRLQAKRDFIGSNLARQEGFKDPLLNEGGSEVAIRRELQAINDLEERIVNIRRAIQFANVTTPITLGGQTRSIQDWLTWRREVAPASQAFISRMRSSIAALRRDAQQKGIGVVSNTNEAKTPMDVIVNVSEAELAEQAEWYEKVLGELDGQLSLKNATITVEIQ